MFDFVLGKFIVEVADWSSEIQFDTTLSINANYFNLKNSHWEPFVEQWQILLRASRVEEEAKHLAFYASCRKKLELNVSHAFLTTLFSAMSAMNSVTTRKSTKRASQYPYIIKNRTGYPLHLWIDSTGNGLDTTISKIANGGDMGWRFDDWRTLRKRTTPTQNRLSIQLEGPPWETLKNVVVDREGTTVYPLRPSLERVTHRLVCQVELKERVKIVTFRSTTVLHNYAHIPVEIMLVNHQRQTSTSIFKVAPNEMLSVPILNSVTDSILLRPLGLGYEWCSQHIFWSDFKTHQPASLATCKALDPAKPQFRFQANIHLNDLTNSKYPYMDVTLLAPFMLENLLPYDINYILFDKATRQEIRGQLKRGAADPVHTVDPTHLLALNIQVIGSELKQKEFVFITSTELQHRDEVLTMIESSGRQLNLKLKYNDAGDKTGRFVKIYCPYVLLNKTGQDMSFSARSFTNTTTVVSDQAIKGPRDPQVVAPLMFSYSSFEPLRSRTRIKVQSSDWSKPLSFEAVGSAFQVTIPNNADSSNVHLGVDIHDGEGKYYLTKVVTFSPRFIVQNNLNETIHVRQAGTTAAVTIEPKASVPFMTLNAAENDLFELCVRLSSSMSDWSNGFSMTQLGTVCVKIGRLNSSDEDLIRADVSLDKASIFITFGHQEGRWPLKIDNSSDVDIIMCQQHATTRYVIPRQTSMPYAWDFPSRDHKRIVIQINGKEHIIDTSRLGQQKSFKYPISGPGRHALLKIELAAEGPTTVVHLMPNNDFAPRQQHKRAGIMSFVLEVLTMTIGNIHDAPIRLNALELEHPNVSANQLVSRIMQFYSQEILGQVHKIIGAADFLGNPVGLFNNVASGVSDMFYEPIQGFQITRPQDFGIGVARGASSLVKKTVFGVTDTLSKFTGSIGKGLSVITMDEKFQESRRLANRNRPKHVVFGVTSGAASLIRGVASGVTGVVSQPLKGAQEAGIGGFFTGLGKGLVGVVTKPMVGFVDLATNVSEGIKNTTTVFDSELDRQRLPRFIGKDKILM
eukprot:jgi/Hompol1/2244/HPOL_005409-RA